MRNWSKGIIGILGTITLAAACVELFYHPKPETLRVRGSSTLDTSDYDSYYLPFVYNGEVKRHTVLVDKYIVL